MSQPQQLGTGRLTGAEKFWYVLQCVAFGGGYFAKVIYKKALSEVHFGVQQGYVAPPAAQAPYVG